MKHKKKIWNHPAVNVFFIFLLCGSLLFRGSEVEATGNGHISLLRIDVNDSIQSLRVPIHAHLFDLYGQEYVLTLLSTTRADTQGLVYTILDADTAGATYFLARTRQR
ncbi:hypothetical protein ACFL27_27915, partial [candidate division CSSED10-310 bacterium]